jgi:hypothetical protein
MEAIEMKAADFLSERSKMGGMNQIREQIANRRIPSRPGNSTK